MTLDEAIKHAEEIAEEQKKLYRLCPASESELFNCDGTNDCKTLENGKNKGCLKCAEEHRQLAEWLKELKQLREQTKWIPVSEKRLPESEYGESNSVSVCFEDETQDVLYFNGSNWCYPTGETYISVNHKNGWHNKVVAWKPLQESYKVEPQESENKT